MLTARQQKWFASVHDGLERETGKSLAEWTTLARACPETAHRKRLAWMKSNYGLGQNRASMVLNAAFPPEASWSTPDALADTLWADPAARAVHESVRALITALPDVVAGQRKTFTAYSRNFQFAALKPSKAGVLLGLAIAPDGVLQAAGTDGWSERLLSKTTLQPGANLPPPLGKWLRAAWERS
jgi:hypothetical protein